MYSRGLLGALCAILHTCMYSVGISVDLSIYCHSKLRASVACIQTRSFTVNDDSSVHLNVHVYTSKYFPGWH